MKDQIILYIHNKLLKPLVNFLKEGLSPEKLALSVALGITIGIIPVLGITTIMCALVAVIFRINMPAIQLINYFVYPLQLILFIPFLKMGAFIFPSEGLVFSLSFISGLLQQDFWLAAQLFWKANLGAMIIWFGISPFLVAIIYYSIFPVFKKFVPDRLKN
ncbi:MAG TPA: DUF2062 domain-containing protein [Bacteroidales bacterium]|nr:DUF2062 domain-containing protein [Bacteroidales bacterium]